jgi:hypothetical protein
LQSTSHAAATTPNSANEIDRIRISMAAT